MNTTSSDGGDSGVIFTKQGLERLRDPRGMGMRQTIRAHASGSPGFIPSGLRRAQASRRAVRLENVFA